MQFPLQTALVADFVAAEQLASSSGAEARIRDFVGEFLQPGVFQSLANQLFISPQLRPPHSLRVLSGACRPALHVHGGRCGPAPPGAH